MSSTEGIGVGEVGKENVFSFLTKTSLAAHLNWVVVLVNLNAQPVKLVQVGTI